MSKIIEELGIIVEKCKGCCPYAYHVRAKQYFCKEPKSENKTIPDGEIIPKWCRLKESKEMRLKQLIPDLELKALGEEIGKIINEQIRQNTQILEAIAYGREPNDSIS